MERKKSGKRACVIALCVCILVATGWMLSAENGFLMDDYTNIVESSSETFSLLPRFRYNDRPTGRILLSYLREFFGMNAQGYHLVLLLIHLLNTFLVYRIAKKLFDEFQVGEGAELAAILSAAIFGAWPQSIMAPQWIAAIPELSCCLFCLCALYFFLKIDGTGPYTGFYTVMTLLCYILALRGKEMPILLPVVLALIDLGRRRQEPMKKRLSLATLLCLGWMLIYLVRLMTFPSIESGPYQQSFNPLVWASNLFRYIGLYCDVWNAPMTFSHYTVSMLPGAVLIVVFTAYAFWSVRKRWLFPLASLVCAGMMLAPVLTMSNMQHKLYLYIPSVFLAIGFSASLARLIGRRKSFLSVVLALILVIAGTNYLPGVQNFRAWWCGMAQQDARQLGQIYRLGDLPPHCNVYVRGVTGDYNVVYPYGPGNCIRLLYDRDDIHCEAVDEFPEDPVYPYVFWEYKDGQFSEVARDNDLKIDVTGLSYSRWSEDTIAIGVTCTPILPDMTIMINGEAYHTTIGETFISTEYPYKAGAEPQVLKITVASEACEIETEPQFLTVQN